MPTPPGDAATTPPTPASPPARNAMDAIGKGIPTAAAIIGLVVTLNTFVVSCSKERIERVSSFRTAVKLEEEFWSGLYDRYLEAVSEGTRDSELRRLKLMAIAMRATHHNPDFAEYLRWDETRARASAAVEQLNQMRKGMRTALIDERSSNSAVAREIEFFLDQQESVRDRRANAVDRGKPPEVTQQAQVSTNVAVQGQPPVVLVPRAGTGAAEPFYESKILAQGSTTGWDIDLFWCVGGTQERQTFSRSLAIGDALAKAAQGDAKLGPAVTLGRIRLRSLPLAQQNGEFGYTRGDSIVADGSPGESEAARVVANFAGRQTGIPLRQVRSVGAATNWYLSIFVCPAGQNAVPPG